MFFWQVFTPGLHLSSQNIINFNLTNIKWYWLSKRLWNNLLVLSHDLFVSTPSTLLYIIWKVNQKTQEPKPHLKIQYNLRQPSKVWIAWLQQTAVQTTIIHYKVFGYGADITDLNKLSSAKLRITILWG